MGVLVGLGGRAGNVIRASPPLTITTGEAERLVTVMSAAVRRAVRPAEH